MNLKKAIILLPLLSYAFDKDYMTSWAKYRLIEMFESTPSESLESYFSTDAWGEFQAQLEKSNLNNYHTDYQTRINKFIKPVSITPSNNGEYYAQSAFLVKFSSSHSSWLQPIEMILTLSESEDGLHITKFEGQTANPIAVKNFALDRANECNSN